MNTARPLIAALTAATLILTACGDDTAGSSTTGDGEAGKKIVAATTWEGALAAAAGATDVTVVVPSSITHAFEYDPKASDLVAVGEADLVLYAEYESFADRLREAAGGDARMEELRLDNTPDVVRAEVRRIAGILGTEDAAEDWLEEFDTTLTEARTTVEQSWRDGEAPKVATQVFVAYMAVITGSQTVGTFGPEPVTPTRLAELSAAGPDLVFDNAHMSTGTVLPDTSAEQVTIVNFPGDDLDLLDVYTANATEIANALGG